MRQSLLLLLVILISCTPTRIVQESFDEGDYAAAISYCKNALASDSTNADIYYLLGKSYAQIDSMDNALEAFERAVFYQPDNLKFRENYFFTTLERGEMFLPDDPTTAMDYFEKAATIDTTNALAVEKIGDLYFDLEKYELAKSDYCSALALKGDTLHIQSRLAKIDSIENIAEYYVRDGLSALEEKKYDKAKALFNKAIDEKPDYKEAQYQLYIATGLRLYKKGSINALWDALDNFGRASFLFPKRGQPHYYSGLAYTKKDKEEFVNAIESFELAISTEPDSKWAEAAKNEADRIRARKKKMDEFFGR